MKVIRFCKFREVIEEDRILVDVMRFRFQIEYYFKEDEFFFNKIFGKYFEEYIWIFNKLWKDIVEDLFIYYIKLSRVINDKEELNIGMVYWLEKYLGYLINVRLWWKLIIKKQEFIIV